MANRQLIGEDDPRLRSPNLLVSDNPAELITDLTETMRSAGLVGIAAPQIGENYQLFLTEPRETPFRNKDQTDVLRVYVNPKIIDMSQDEVVMYEGCGSVNKINSFGPVSRPKEVTIETPTFRLTCDGLLARIIQHEMDHLNGILFIDKVVDKSKILTYEEYLEYKKTAPVLNITKIELVSL